MTYGRFPGIPGYWVDDYRRSHVKVVEQQLWKLLDPDLDNRIQRLRVDLPYNAPELITKLRDANISFDSHPIRNDGAIWGLFGNLIFPILLIGGLFLLFRRSSNIIPGRSGQAMNFGKSKARFQMEAKTGLNLMMLLALMKPKKNSRSCDIPQTTGTLHCCWSADS